MNMNKNVVKLNETQLRKIVTKTIKEALEEVNSLTADSAYEKAKQKYQQFVDSGQENTPQAQKIKRQMNAFKAYNDFNTDGTPESINNKNAYGHSAAEYMKDIAGAYGMKDFNPEQYVQTDNQYRANGKQYDYNNMSQNAMNQHHQFNNLPYVKGQDYNNMQSPKKFGLQYNQGKKGFLGMGKQRAGWTATNESKLNKIVSESIKKVLKEAQWSPEADGVGPSDVKGPAYFKKNGVVKVGSTEQGQVWATLGFFGNKHIAKSIGARWDTASNQNHFYYYTINSNGLLFICKTAEGYYQLLYKNGRLEMASDVNDNAVDDLSRFQWVDAMVQPRFEELMNRAMELCKEERQYGSGNAYKM